MSGAVLRDAREATPAWLAGVLGEPVAGVRVRDGEGRWSRQARLAVERADGTVLALRLKICLGDTFGRSEVDYYTRDYLGLADAPLVRCFDARYAPGIGYHLLLEDLADTHHDRRDAPPTRAYGLAVAAALGRLHRHHWQRVPAPDAAALDRYFDAIRPGLGPIEQATGLALRAGFERHERAMRARWADPRGMTLLHGDLNPTNVLTPRGAEQPVWFLDRQPFDWSLTSGLAVHDLAGFLVPWWPEAQRRADEDAVLQAWHAALGRADYPWAQARADWRLAVAQCLHVPVQWCASAEARERMRWLWQAQLDRVLAAIADATARDGDPA